MVSLSNHHTSYLSFLVHHHIFWIEKSTSKKCVNLRRKLPRKKQHKFLVGILGISVGILGIPVGYLIFCWCTWFFLDLISVLFIGLRVLVCLLGILVGVLGFLVGVNGILCVIFSE